MLERSGAGAPRRGGPAVPGRMRLLMRIDAPAAAPPARVALVDAARGVALLAMFAYHFAWDLDHYELISTDIGASRPWSLLARLTAGSFLALVGVSLVLARRGGFRPGPFLRRLAVIGGAAALVTLATWLLMPEDFIYFGILHCIAVSSVLALPFLRLPLWIVLAAAVFCFLAPSLFAAPTFDAPWLRWLGLMTYFPPTNDYVPLFPWFGAVLTGIAAARIALAVAGGGAWARWRPANAFSRVLVWGGRHSLGIYLLHQPVFLGALYLVALAVGPVPASEATALRQSCETSCVGTGASAGTCSAACLCWAERLQAEGLWTNTMADSLSPPERDRAVEAWRQCRGRAPEP